MKSLLFFVRHRENYDCDDSKPKQKAFPAKLRRDRCRRRGNRFERASYFAFIDKAHFSFPQCRNYA
jgi:hypothetical protein